MKHYHVNVTVECVVLAADEHAAALQAETGVQTALDRTGKRLHAVAGADYGDVTVADEIDRSKLRRKELT